MIRIGILKVFNNTHTSIYIKLYYTHRHYGTVYYFNYNNTIPYIYANLLSYSYLAYNSLEIRLRFHNIIKAYILYYLSLKY